MIIRPIDRPQELAVCVELQQIVWGFQKRDLVTKEMLETARKNGGALLGAFSDDGPMIGFVFGFPSCWNNQLAEHSHMLAVLNEFRDQGVGYALKQAQYRDALERGIPLITWTFDPLEAKNAHLNLNKLGAIVRRYYVNLYGESTSSALHQGLGTDRFLVEWRVGRQPSEPRPLGSGRRPRAERGSEGARRDSDLLIEIPADIQALKDRDPELARRWRSETRAAFTHYLALGYEVLRLVKKREGDVLRTFYSLRKSSP